MVYAGLGGSIHRVPFWGIPITRTMVFWGRVEYNMYTSNNTNSRKNISQKKKKKKKKNVFVSALLHPYTQPILLYFTTTTIQVEKVQNSLATPVHIKTPSSNFLIILGQTFI